MPPSGWELPPTLLELRLGANKIAGTIPANWSLPEQLQVLDLNENALVSSIPESWSLPATLEELSMTFNQLRGPVRPQHAQHACRSSSILLYQPPHYCCPAASLHVDCMHHCMNAWPYFCLQTCLGSLHRLVQIPAKLALPSGLRRYDISTNLLTGTVWPDGWRLPDSLEVGLYPAGPGHRRPSMHHRATWSCCCSWDSFSTILLYHLADSVHIGEPSDGDAAAAGAGAAKPPNTDPLRYGHLRCVDGSAGRAHC